MAYKTLNTTVDEPKAGRIDLLVRDLTELSRSQVRGLFDHGCVSINDAPCSDIGHYAAAGDHISVCFDPHRRYKEKKRVWDDRTFKVIHEDDFLIVVDKAAGTLTVPTDNEDPNTLVDRVSTYLNHSRRNKVAWVVHRLDRDVSGLVVFGKQELIGNALIEQFKHLHPKRVYTAIVAGVIEDETGELEPAIIPSTSASGNARSQKGRRDKPLHPPKEPVVEVIPETPTQYKVLSRSRDTTFVEITLDSGQRNSIRAQFAGIGHPILGDRRCNDDDANHPRWIRKRIALHAKTLTLDHPVTQQTLTFESPLPTAMQKFISGSKSESRATDTASGATQSAGNRTVSPWDKAKRKKK